MADTKTCNRNGYMFTTKLITISRTDFADLLINLKQFWNLRDTYFCLMFKS